MRARAVLLIALSLAVSTTSWVALAGGAGAAADAAKKKPTCDPKKAAAQIAPLYDVNANTDNSLTKRLSVVQWGNLKAVKEQVKAVDASNPVTGVRAKPIANVTFPDKRSAIGELTITIGPEQEINQGQQFFMCVGKEQNGTAKGAWRITLYSLCNLYLLEPCSDALVERAVNSLTPALAKQTTQ
jgi:hypothetical protein